MCETSVCVCLFPMNWISHIGVGHPVAYVKCCTWSYHGLRKHKSNEELQLKRLNVQISILKMNDTSHSFIFSCTHCLNANVLNFMQMSISLFGLWCPFTLKDPPPCYCRPVSKPAWVFWPSEELGRAFVVMDLLNLLVWICWICWYGFVEFVVMDLLLQICWICWCWYWTTLRNYLHILKCYLGIATSGAQKSALLATYQEILFYVLFS